MTHPWSIPGVRGEPIRGESHLPPDAPRGSIIIAHGFKGYMDYGMLPLIAQACAEARVIAHRFNFSHSGIGDDPSRFDRADLFEQDTWSTQIEDLTRVIDALRRGGLPGDGSQAPIVLLGHSRGGTVAVITASRLTEVREYSDRSGSSGIAGVITIAAPHDCNPLTSEQCRELLEQGYLASPSARTGQVLRIGRAFLQEQLDDPAAHDVLAHAAALRVPLLILHGDADSTVSVVSARHIAEACGSRCRIVLIAGGDHVLNTPNPAESAAPGPQLMHAIREIMGFLHENLP